MTLHGHCMLQRVAMVWAVGLAAGPALAADTLWTVLSRAGRAPAPQQTATRAASRGAAVSQSPQPSGKAPALMPQTAPSRVASAPGAESPAPAMPAEASTALAESTKSSDRLWDLLQLGARRGPLTPHSPAPSAGTQAPSLAQSTVSPAPAAGESAGTGTRPKRGGFLGMMETVGTTFRQIGQRTNSSITASGNYRMGFHMEDISGNRETYQNSTYFGRPFGAGYSDANLDLRGKIFGIINFETRYSNNLYGNPHDNRLSLNYATKFYSIDIGDIQARITGNSLIDFSRSVKGIQLGVEPFRGVKITNFLTEPRAQTRTIIINGANRSGPYYVYAGQVVDGSVKIRVNDREMVLDRDYTLDPFTGELNFRNGFIVHELDVIAVTFETYGYNQQAGRITGVRADITRMKSAKFGLTFMQQLSGADKSQGAYKTERFYGFNSPNTPYQLDYPVDLIVQRDPNGNIVSAVPRFPMYVTVGNLPQVYGTDYLVDPNLPNRVFFSQPIPSTQIIVIRYVPLTANDTPGDRSVLAFDSNISLGKLGTLTAEMASSTLMLGNNKVNGGAWQLKSATKFLNNRLTWDWSLKNIGSGFTSIESPGFRRNESGLTTAFGYKASSNLDLKLSLDRTKRPSYSFGGSYFGTQGGQNLAGRDDFNQLLFSAIWRLGSGNLQFTHNNMRTELATGGHTSYGSTQIAYNQSIKAFSLDVSLGRNNSKSITNVLGSGSSGTGQSLRYGSDALTARLGLQYRPSESLSLQTMLTNSALKSLEGKQSTARDISFIADYLPLKNLRIRGSYQLQDSGGYSMFSTTSGGITRASDTRQSSGGFGSGYYGGTTTFGGLGSGYFGGGVSAGLGGYGNYSGGFGTGVTGSYGLSSYGGKSRNATLGISYQPAPPLTLELMWMNSASDGDYLFNSKRNDLSFNLGYQVGERWMANANISTTRVAYTGGNGSSSSNMMYLGLRGKPWGKLTTSLSYQLMRTSNTGSTGSLGGATGSTGSSTGNLGNWGNYLGGGGLGSSTGGYYGFYGSGGTNLNSYLVRLEYPIFRGNSLFLQYDNSKSSGYLASTQTALSFGLLFDLNRQMQFSLGWRNQRFISNETTAGSGYSYNVRSLDADISMRF